MTDARTVSKGYPVDATNLTGHRQREGGLSVKFTHRSKPVTSGCRKRDFDRCTFTRFDKSKWQNWEYTHREDIEALQGLVTTQDGPKKEFQIVKGHTLHVTTQNPSRSMRLFVPSNEYNDPHLSYQGFGVSEGSSRYNPHSDLTGVPPTQGLHEDFRAVIYQYEQARTRERGSSASGRIFTMQKSMGKKDSCSIEQKQYLTAQVEDRCTMFVPISASDDPGTNGEHNLLALFVRDHIRYPQYHHIFQDEIGHVSSMAWLVDTKTPGTSTDVVLGVHQASTGGDGTVTSSKTTTHTLQIQLSDASSHDRKELLSLTNGPTPMRLQAPHPLTSIHRLGHFWAPSNEASSAEGGGSGSDSRKTNVRSFGSIGRFIKEAFSS